MTRWLLTFVAVLALGGCGYNDFQRLDEQTKSAWSEVLNQYQRRADLVPNIVATVKGEAAFEQDTLTKVIDARAKATSIQVTPETLNSPEAFKKFEAAQGELGNALSRLMVVSEQYPSLKANQGFHDLRVQLEGTENRVTVARNRYIQAVQDYNVLARSFPSNLTAMLFSYAAKSNFTVQNEATVSAPPVVDFTKKNNQGDRSGSGWLNSKPEFIIERWAVAKVLRCAEILAWFVGGLDFGRSLEHASTV